MKSPNKESIHKQKPSVKKSQLQGLEKLFSFQPVTTEFLDVVVPFDMAKDCITNYRNIYSDPVGNAAAITKSYTYSADFGSKALSDWALDVVKNSNANFIKVVFGLYTPLMAATYSVKPGRLTVFLSPQYLAPGALPANSVQATYNSTSTSTYGAADAPVDPFNLAGIEP